jgi:hypothetical protein
MIANKSDHPRTPPRSAFAKLVPPTFAAGCLALGIVLVSATGTAATVTVNTTTPDNANDGKCGWVEAVQAVNQGSSYRNCAYVSDGQSDKIVLPAGTHAGSGATLERDVTLVGAGQGSTIIKSQDFCTICALGGTITLSNLTLQHDSSSTFPVFGVFVAPWRSNVTFLANAVRVTGFHVGIELDDALGVISETTIDTNVRGLSCFSCTLWMDSSTVSNNTNSGIWLEHAANHDMVNSSVVSSTIQNNSTDGDGGGIFVQSDGDPGSPILDIVSSTIRGNHANGRGGGVFVTGHVQFKDTVIDANTADVWGGGVATAGGPRGAWHTPISFETTVLTANSAPLGGGAVFDNGSAPVFVDSTISNNVATATDGGGVALFGENRLNTLHRTLVAGNHADRGRGGGIFNSSARNEDFDNTTLTANSAARGGAIWHEPSEFGKGELHLRHCTIANNTATQHSGGMYADISNPLIEYSIIINNSAPSNPDAWFNYPPEFGPFNLVRTALGLYFPANQQNVLLAAGANPGVDTVLRRLGGPTQVLRLLPNSPAIDRIPGPLKEYLMVDQRSVPRPQFGGVDGTKADIGAFEVSRP